MSSIHFFAFSYSRLSFPLLPYSNRLHRMEIEPQLRTWWDLIDVAHESFHITMFGGHSSESQIITFYNVVTAYSIVIDDALAYSQYYRMCYLVLSWVTITILCCLSWHSPLLGDLVVIAKRAYQDSVVNGMDLLLSNVTRQVHSQGRPTAAFLVFSSKFWSMAV